MAFFPLFIDPSTHLGALTFGAMAVTIAVLTAVYCLTLCACAKAVSTRVSAHKHVASLLQKFAGLCLVGFGLRLLRD